MTDLSYDDAPDLIRVMPESLANKIAAGEVVQRPAAAVKELMENAVDAGATHVTVVVKSAGSELIQIIDNGGGMSAPDAVACFQRHATSKIHSVEDLERICTLGFRGEALASIASVAQVELKTRRIGDPHGTRVEIHGGDLAANEPCACPPGTSLAVRNLFYNVPARRNFLKSAATEFKHVVETFQFLALSHPEIGFTLLHDDHEIYRLVPAAEPGFHTRLRHRIWELWGKSVADNLIETEEITGYVSVRGLISKPTFYRRSKGEQFLFVNDRFVRNRYLEHAVTSGYESTLPEGAHPFYVLFLDVDPRHVDVNVHPTKAEVKFDDERGVYGLVRTVIKKAVGLSDLAPQFAPAVFTGADDDFPSPRPTSFGGSPASPAAFAPRVPAPFERSGAPPARPPDRSTFFEPRSARPLDMFGGSLGDASDLLYGHTPPASASIPSAVMPDAAAKDESGAENALLWQLHDRYILTQIRSGLMLLDQYAAHQRILYEKALQIMQDGLGLSQQLLFPHTIEVSPADHDLLKELLPDLRALGFDLEFFSGRSVVVRGVPADIRAGSERTILEEVVEQYRTNRDTLQIASRENLARSIARRSAISPGTRLKPNEMRALIDQLFMCTMPYADPTGHPTLVKLSMEELEKRFGR